MKKRIAVVCLLLLMLFAASALASTPTHGRTRIYGYKDEIKQPRNMFAPYAVFTDVPHVEDHYLEFYYNKIDSAERIWSLSVVDEEWNPAHIDGLGMKIYLPYPSIWSAKDRDYWKWTKTYAQKHYQWEWARGLITGWFRVIDTFSGSYYQRMSYMREDYRPVRNMENFGNEVYVTRKTFFNGMAIFISLEGEGIERSSTHKTAFRLPSIAEDAEDYLDKYENLKELNLPEGTVSFSTKNIPNVLSGRKMLSLKRIIWPESLKDGTDLRELAPNLKEIWYRGSEEQWKNTTGWTLFKNVKVTYEYKD